MKSLNKNHSNKKRNPATVHLLSLFVLAVIFSLNIVSAAVPIKTLATPITDPKLNPNNSAFKIVVCDGPFGAKTPSDTNYTVCDFNGVMLQIQHLINIMMVLGVFAALAGFSYAGGLYITGVQGNITKAHKIFPKVFFGFIIMLSAWFIVYQILSWLTNDSSGFKTLLGNP